MYAIVTHTVNLAFCHLDAVLCEYIIYAAELGALLSIFEYIAQFNAKVRLGCFLSPLSFPLAAKQSQN